MGIIEHPRESQSIVGTLLRLRRFPRRHRATLRVFALNWLFETGRGVGGC